MLELLNNSHCCCLAYVAGLFVGDGKPGRQFELAVAQLQILSPAHRRARRRGEDRGWECGQSGKQAAGKEKTKATQHSLVTHLSSFFQLNVNTCPHNFSAKRKKNSIKSATGGDVLLSLPLSLIFPPPPKIAILQSLRCVPIYRPVA